MIWIIRLIQKTDQSKVNNICKNGLSIPLKAGSIFTGIPQNDATVNFKFNC